MRTASTSPREASALIAALVIAPLSVWFVRFVSTYGVEGALRFLWEGSPYPSSIRDRMEELEDIREAIRLLELNELCQMEDNLRIARSMQSATTHRSSRTHLKQWESLLGGRDLRLALSVLSDRLDMLAARIDAVPKDDDVEIKIQKKDLSTTIVMLMNRLDTLMQFYVESSN